MNKIASFPNEILSDMHFDCIGLAIKTNTSKCRTHKSTYWSMITRNLEVDILPKNISISSGYHTKHVTLVWQKLLARSDKTVRRLKICTR